MRSKSLALLLLLALVFISLAGCSHTISFTSPAEKRKDSISSFIADNITGDVAAKTGDSYTTKWFEFTVHSIEKTDTYADYTAKEGHQLYKAVISLKSTWNESLSMGIFDFYVDAPDYQEYIWAVPPLDDAMMPEEYALTPSETVQYIIIFEAPIGTVGLSLNYTENFDDGNDGVTFSIPIDS